MPPANPPTITLDQFARGRLDALLRRLNAEVIHVCRKSDPDAIHDLRVSIRRLTQALRALRGLFPKRDIRPMRRDLREMMDLAAEVRNRDIALELFAASGVDAGTPVCRHLAQQRDAAQTAILALARKWRSAKLPASWKSLLQGRAE